MALSSSFSLSPLSSISKVDQAEKTLRHCGNDGRKRGFDFPLTSSNTELFGHQLVTVRAHLHKNWGGSGVTMRPKLERIVPLRKISRTKISMESSTPYIVRGVLYAYLLYLSWTPETLQLIFASKYWLPELPGIGRMFSNEVTLASAWIHLLVVDLFAARFFAMDWTMKWRRDISLCLFFCLVGIVAHVITKALTKNAGSSSTRNMH